MDMSEVSVFQFTQSRGLRPLKVCHAQYSCHNFNSRSHVDCDLWPDVRHGQEPYFNSRSHVDCDATAYPLSLNSSIFQFTQSRGLRRNEPESVLPHVVFQFTQSRGLRPTFWPVLVFVSCISIHAVTWTATLYSIRDLVKPLISIHAVTWTATFCSRICCLRLRYFNSRSHVDCDLLHQPVLHPPVSISIHAVTWTATMVVGLHIPILTFQFTQSRGLRPQDIAQKA